MTEPTRVEGPFNAGTREYAAEVERQALMASIERAGDEIGEALGVLIGLAHQEGLDLDAQMTYVLDASGRPPMNDSWPPPRSVWWCKDRSGRIVEHETSATEGHEGHVRCVPVSGWLREAPDA